MMMTKLGCYLNTTAGGIMDRKSPFTRQLLKKVVLAVQAWHSLPANARGFLTIPVMLKSQAFHHLCHPTMRSSKRSPEFPLESIVGRMWYSLMTEKSSLKGPKDQWVSFSQMGIISCSYMAEKFYFIGSCTRSVTELSLVHRTWSIISITTSKTIVSRTCVEQMGPATTKTAHNLGDARTICQEEWTNPRVDGSLRQLRLMVNPNIWEPFWRPRQQVTHTREQLGWQTGLGAPISTWTINNEWVGNSGKYQHHNKWNNNCNKILALHEKYLEFFWKNSCLSFLTDPINLKKLI